MFASVNQIVILGLPLAMVFGIVTFICLVTTAVLGILVLKGLYHIPFKWHMRMAAATIVFAVIHVVLVLLLFF
ncbi:MAG: hypothetical protein LUQ66_03380 [Methanoregula sp.]|nr:hypothetical protein [Methanoregula sp.]